jgi:ABC-type transport system substrate-binding protein
VNRRDRLALLGLFLAIAVVGAALLIGAPGGSNQAASPSSGGVPYREGVLGHPSSINPLTPRTQADQDLVALLFRGLVKAGPSGTVVPDLATWTASDDGRSYTFNMRNDAYWDDGQPVTSADVVFTIGLVQDPAYEGPVGSSWQGVHAAADGPSTVKITMTLPIAGFLREAELPILPSHLLNGTSIGGLADSIYSTRPVGDGPYRIAELDYSHALLERVTAVTGAPPITPVPSGSARPSTSASQLVFATATPPPTQAPQVSVSQPPTPAPTATPTAAPTPTPSPSPTPTEVPLPSGATLATITEIEMTFYDDASLAAADFQFGKLDAVGGLPPAVTDAAAKTAGSRTVAYQTASLMSVALNQRSTNPELRDANAKTGLLAAIDRKALLSSVLEGRGSVADLPIPSWSPAYDGSSVIPTLYSVAEAQGFLTTAGWQQSADGWTAPNGKSIYTMELLTLDAASSPLGYQTALSVAASWRAIGLTVQIDAVATPTYVDRLDNGDFAAAIVNFEVGLDPDLGPILLSSQVGQGGSNVSGVQDPTLDQLLLAVRKTVAPAARKDAISALEKYVSTTLPILPLVFRDYYLVVSGRVRKVVSNQIADPSGRFWDVIDWRLASGR